MIVVCVISSLKLTNRPISQKPAYAFKIHRCVRRAVVGPPLPPCLSFCLLFALYPFFVVTLWLPIFFPYVSLPSLTTSIRVPSSLTARGAILCHFVSFSRFAFRNMCPPFLRYNQTLSRFSSNSLGHPRVLSLFFHLSISFSLLLPVSSSLSLPLCSAHLQHIKIPLFFLQRIVRSLRDLLHSSMFSLPLSLHICLPLFLSLLAALHSVWFSLSSPLSF